MKNKLQALLQQREALDREIDLLKKAIESGLLHFQVEFWSGIEIDAFSDLLDEAGLEDVLEFTLTNDTCGREGKFEGFVTEEVLKKLEHLAALARS